MGVSAIGDGVIVRPLRVETGDTAAALGGAGHAGIERAFSFG